MTQSPVRSAQLERQARLMNVINVPMRLLLQLPFATPLSRQLMLLVLRGRKSGKVYRQPVSFVRDGETLLTPGGGRWKLNLREGECVRIRLSGWTMLYSTASSSCAGISTAESQVRRAATRSSGADEWSNTRAFQEATPTPSGAARVGS